MNNEKTSQVLTKESIAGCIEQNIANDYHRFDYICSGVKVINFERVENSLIVEYSFWDDGHALDDQSYYLFDLDNVYGVNFPSCMQLCEFKSKLTWNSLPELESLSADFGEDVDTVDVTAYHWGDPEIDDSWINFYINNDPESLALMLIEHYQADIKMPDFVPPALVPHFKQLISENLTK